MGCIIPYIKNRDRFDKKIEELLFLVQTTESIKGQINYIITRLVHRYIEQEIGQRGKSYDVLSQGYDVLCEATAEYYKQVLGKYEDKKKLENGAISSLDAVTLNDVR